MPVGAVILAGIFIFEAKWGITPRHLAIRVVFDTLITLYEHRFSRGASVG
jgi:hypothetical protein